MEPEEQPEFPTVFAIADAFSLNGQRRVVRATALRLSLVVIATLCLSLAPLWPTEWDEHREVEVLGIVAAGLFLVAFVYEIWLLRQRPERDWYDGRAVAESSKTLTWRYAVGGNPYPTGQDAEEAFPRDIRSLGTDVPALREAAITGAETTEWMRRLRATDLDTRREVYLKSRIRDQEEWYTRKAHHHLRRSRAWAVALLLAEGAGVLLALLKSLSVMPIDLASLAAAAIASGAAWLGLKQHESVGTAYELASSELASVHVGLLAVVTEERWSEEVASAEEAISREHTMWRAARIASPAKG